MLHSMLSQILRRFAQAKPSVRRLRARENMNLSSESPDSSSESLSLKIEAKVRIASLAARDSGRERTRDSSLSASLPSETIWSFSGEWRPDSGDNGGARRPCYTPSRRDTSWRGEQGVAPASSWLRSEIASRGPRRYIDSAKSFTEHLAGELSE